MGWYNSPEYQETRETGESYGKDRNFAVPGVAPKWSRTLRLLATRFCAAVTRIA